MNINTPINHVNKKKEKYMITTCIPELLFKKIYVFSSSFFYFLRMSENKINFDNRKIKKVTFTN